MSANNMIDAIRRICELQPYYSLHNTPEMQERGRLIRQNLADAIRLRAEILSVPLDRFGRDFHVQSSDGIGRKTELPWVRFCSLRMSPSPTEGFYCVLHFSTDGSAFYITVGCGSSQFRNGSFTRLPASELDRRTDWARQVILEAEGTTEPFNDAPTFGARRPLPKSFERATALAKRVSLSDLEMTDIDGLLAHAARYLRIVYQAEAEGRGLSPADQSEIEIERILKPTSPSLGQGYRLSAADRKKIELRAMELAREWLENEGYVVTDKSANHSYDFEARRDGSAFKVEVKGTTSDTPDAILMTRNEVDLHRREKGETALILVSSIRLPGPDGEEATGGELEAFIGWDIEDWCLRSETYRVERPRGVTSCTRHAPLREVGIGKYSS